MFSLNQGISFQVHGGSHSGGPASVANDLLVSLDSLAGLSSTELFATLLPGVATMVNLHPLAVHFPIALLILFFWVELAASVFRQARWHTVASGLLYLGTLFAMITVYLGFQAAETVAHDDAVHLIMEKHETLGVAILSMAAFLSLWRVLFKVHKSLIAQFMFLLFGLILQVLIVAGADLGGLMVYQHGVSVQMNKPVSVGLPGEVLNSAHEHTHDHGSHHHH